MAALNFWSVFLILQSVLLLVWAGVRHEGHSHHRPSKDRKESALKDKELLRDLEHIKEDLHEQYDFDLDDDSFKEEDMDRYYFQLHDLDKDQKLDGLELLAAINHVTSREGEEGFPDADSFSPLSQLWWNAKFEEDAEIIDQILKEEDLDHDGYVDYLEFAIGRQLEK